MDIAAHIRDIPDFPKNGIIFKDITPLLQDPKAFRQVIDQFYEHYKDMKVDAIISAESRGFIFGAPLAYKLGCSFVPIRKPGKLPYKTLSCSYEKEYGTDTLCMHEDAIQSGQRVIIIDDLLATGGTAKAMVEMVEKAGGKMIEAGFVIELDFLKARELLDVPIYSMLHY